MRDSLQLPSKGKVYQVPLESITVRSLKGGDEKLLSDLTLDNLENKYLLLLKNRIKNGLPVVSGIEPEKLTLGLKNNNSRPIYIQIDLNLNFMCKNVKTDN